MSQKMKSRVFCWSIGFEDFLFTDKVLWWYSIGSMFPFWIIMMNPCFDNCHNPVKKFLAFILVLWQQLLENFNSWSFCVCCEEPIPLSDIEQHQLCDPHIPIRCQASQQFPFEWQELFLLVQTFSCDHHRSSTLVLITQISSSRLTTLTFFGPKIHSTYIKELSA